MCQDQAAAGVGSGTNRLESDTVTGNNNSKTVSKNASSNRDLKKVVQQQKKTIGRLRSLLAELLAETSRRVAHLKSQLQQQMLDNN